jgi:2-dehydro-3-deoxyglucarate aldolase
MNRLKVISSIRHRLKSGAPSIGSWMQLPDPSVAEIMGRSGYDWVAVDMEHGSIGHHQLPNIFRALELGDTLPLVRLAEGSSQNCKQALDAGAGGVIVPCIESADQLQKIHDACRWPPAGNRGVGFSRANLFGGIFEEYRQEAQAPLLIAMIESIEAVKNLEEILAVNGLDAILIGPYDLSASLGLTAQFDHEDFCAAMNIIIEKTKLSKVASGIHVVAPAKNELSERLNEGYQFIAYSIDAVFLRASAQKPQL